LCLYSRTGSSWPHADAGLPCGFTAGTSWPLQQRDGRAAGRRAGAPARVCDSTGGARRHRPRGGGQQATGSGRRAAGGGRRAAGGGRRAALSAVRGADRAQSVCKSALIVLLQAHGPRVVVVEGGRSDGHRRRRARPHGHALRGRRPLSPSRLARCPGCVGPPRCRVAPRFRSCSCDPRDATREDRALFK
jgi:hypothetical protein